MKNIDNNLKSFKLTLSKIKQINLSETTQSQLIQMLNDSAKLVQSGKQSDDLVPQVFAIINEAVIRTLKVVPYDSQLLTALAMNEGRIVELPTGEGKTIAAVFTAILNSLNGLGVHVLTFNDYLAKRDANWMRPVYEYLGVTVGFVTAEMVITDRKLAYLTDVTYLTAKQAGFDYLRNFLVYDKDEIVGRGFFLAIVDEADSILIDEARIPLVIASDMQDIIEIKPILFEIIEKLQEKTHYDTDEYAYTINLTEQGTLHLEQALNISNLYSTENLHLLTKINLVLQALFMLSRDVDYIVKDGKVLLIDQYTGRIISNRKWPDGLQTAVELKEHLQPQQHSRIISKITLQNFILLYPNICGMTGTAVASAGQFYEFYNKCVTVIPPNFNNKRIDHEDIIFTHKQAKYDALVAEIVKVQATGRPILVGMSSVEESEQLAKMLNDNISMAIIDSKESVNDCDILQSKNHNIPVLNAKNDHEEAMIIAEAGKKNAVTISTNMAGRGVDILLGGTNGDCKEEIVALGGLYVIGTAHYESRRIDDQLRGRAGRQGDNGDTRFFVSLEDDLIVKYKISDSIPKRYKGVKQAEPLNDLAIKKAVEHTQKVAEGQALDAKITQEKYNAILEDQRAIIFNHRENILRGTQVLSLLAKHNDQLYNLLLEQVGEQNLLFSDYSITLYAFNEYYGDFLGYADEVLDQVKVIGTVGGQPLSHTNRALIEQFASFEQDIANISLDIYERAIINDGKIDLLAMKIYAPTSTHTYMLQDGVEEFDALESFAKGLIRPKKLS